MNRRLPRFPDLSPEDEEMVARMRTFMRAHAAAVAAAQRRQDAPLRRQAGSGGAAPKRPNRAAAARAVRDMTRAVAGPPIEPGNPTLLLRGVIGDITGRGRQIVAKDIEATLARYRHAEAIDLVIDSPGGVAAEAYTIYN